MTSSELQDLLVRVEAATGPDRELDARIVVAFDLRPDWVGDAGVLWLDTKDWRPTVRLNSPGLRKSQGNPPLDDDEIPHFTESLDAALALCARVLPGWLWKIACAGDDRPGRFDALLMAPHIAARDIEAKASTPALALLAAMLKAKIAEAASPASAPSKAPEEPVPSKPQPLITKEGRS